MAIPDYQSFMKPLLEFASDRCEHSTQEAYDELAKTVGLSDEEKEQLLPSGRQQTYKNRIGWARTYLTKAGLLSNTRRGHFEITDRGMDELRDHGDEISAGYLKKYEEFVEFQTPNSGAEDDDSVKVPAAEAAAQTPEETIDRAVAELDAQLSDEILDALRQSSPSFFERVVVDLLVSMGYGGSRKEAAQVVGQAGDEGIDGIIKEDRLGLDAIYIQAKRWEAAVGRPEIQKFVGALQGKRAQKGIFITTSRFSSDAREYALQVQNTVILINGAELARLMIEHNVGTSTVGTYFIKRLDSDYFLEE
jgi:restriction system protein